MGGVFGGGKAAKRAARRAEATARRQEQRGNEEEQRARQLAERGAEAGRGRNLLVGYLSRRLPTTLGAAGQ